MFPNPVQHTTYTTGDQTTVDQAIRDLFSVSSPLQYNNATGQFSITQAIGGNSGYITPGDYNHWNNDFLLKLDGIAESSSGEVTVADFGARKLYYTSSVYMDFSSGFTFINPTGGIIAQMSSGVLQSQGFSAVDWFNRRLVDSAGTSTMDWAARTLYAIDGTAVLNWNANQSANTFFSGPSTGAATHPAFRTIAIADINTALGSRTINTTAPLTGGGVLSSDLTLAMPQATNLVSGYLSSTDWSTFNNKQSALSFPLSIDRGGTFNAGPLTTNGVMFYDGTRIRQDINAAAINPTNHNFGIRAQVPIVPLHVGGCSEGTPSLGSQIGLFQNSGNCIFAVQSFRANLAGFQFGDADSIARGIFYYNNNADEWQIGAAGAATHLRIISTGQVGIGVTGPTAMLHLQAGTATANTAPLKFTAGTNLTAPEDGAMEFDGTHLYITIAGVRQTII